MGRLFRYPDSAAPLLRHQQSNARQRLTQTSYRRSRLSSIAALACRRVQMRIARSPWRRSMLPTSFGIPRRIRPKARLWPGTTFKVSSRSRALTTSASTTTRRRPSARPTTTRTTPQASTQPISTGTAARPCSLDLSDERLDEPRVKPIRADPRAAWRYRSDRHTRPHAGRKLSAARHYLDGKQPDLCHPRHPSLGDRSGDRVLHLLPPWAALPLGERAPSQRRSPGFGRRSGLLARHLHPGLQRDGRIPGLPPSGLDSAPGCAAARLTIGLLAGGSGGPPATNPRPLPSWLPQPNLKKP